MPILEAPSGSVNGPGQHNQPSRKGKKAWRKNVDVSAVEQGLEALSEQKTQRGAALPDLPTSELWTVDCPDESIIAFERAKDRRPLKVDEIIGQRSKVPAVVSRKRSAEKTTSGLAPTKRRRKDYVPNKEIRRLRHVADGHHEEAVAHQDVSYDVWSDDQGDALARKPSTTSHTIVKAPETLRREPVSLAANGRRIRAVPKLPTSYSYNPAFPDYHERYVRECEKENEAELKRIVDKEAERETREAIRRSGAAAAAGEARAELAEWDEDSEWEGFQSGPDAEAVSAKPPQRKTKAQRNKIKRRLEQTRRARREAEIKRKNDQVASVKKYAREVAARQRALAATKLDKSETGSEGDEDDIRRKPLGNGNLPAKHLELVLPSELEDSLRRLKPEGNLMRDRYRSLLVRGRVEARRRISFKKQARTNITEKWTHKDFILH